MDSHLLHHDGHSVTEFAHHIADLQSLVGSVVAEVLVCVLVVVLVDVPVELRQRVTPGSQQLEDHLYQLLSLWWQLEKKTYVSAVPVDLWMAAG